ncbi:MAG TPA: hypothetical protein VKE94_14430 [Gemmataceae bacterium]|nr:hypothetical protein [Gemmataceae bacterium]
MDHKEQHHQQHQKEREREKHREAEREREVMREPRTIHPAWFVAVGVVLVVAAVLVWTFILS